MRGPQKYVQQKPVGLILILDVFCHDVAYFCDAETLFVCTTVTSIIMLFIIIPPARFMEVVAVVIVLMVVVELSLSFLIDVVLHLKNNRGSRCAVVVVAVGRGSRRPGHSRSRDGNLSC